MKKRLNKRDWRTWDVGALIPEKVLRRMVAIPGFDVNFTLKAARSHLKRIAWCYETKEIYMEMLERHLRFLDPEPASDNVYTLGGILEYAFIIKRIEEALQEAD